jgi:hypothetical protein
VYVSHAVRRSGNLTVGCFRVRILELGDGSHDLRHADQSIREDLDPNSDIGAAILSCLAEGVDVAAAGRHLVDVPLDHARRNHSEGAERETGGDLLDGGEFDTRFSQTRVDEEVHDGDQDDDEDRVQLGYDIVGCFSEFHGIGLRNEIVGHLVVGEPVERVPQEHFACEDTALYFVDPGVVEGHPGRDHFATGTKCAGLDPIPETIILEGVLPWRLLDTETNELEGFPHDRSGGWRQLVVLLHRDKDDGAEQVANSWECVGEPEADEVLETKSVCASCASCSAKLTSE